MGDIADWVANVEISARNGQVYSPEELLQAVEELTKLRERCGELSARLTECIAVDAYMSVVAIRDELADMAKGE